MRREPSLRELGALVGLTLLVRGVAAQREQLLFGDAPHFIYAARALEAGEWQAALAHEYHPLTSLLMAAIAAVSGLEIETAGRVLGVLSGGIAVTALYLFACRAFGRPSALLASLLFAVHPRTVAVASSVQSDGLHLALLLVGVLATWAALESRRSLPALGASIACGLAYLTRPEGLAVGVVFLTWLWADCVRGRTARGTAARQSLVFLAPALLLVVGYVAGMYGASGSWMLSGKKSLLGILRVDRAVAAPGTLILALQGVVRDGVRAIHPAVLAFVLLGLARARADRATLFVLSFAGIFLALLLGVYLEAGYISRRHWLGPAVLLFPLAARGWLYLVDLVGRRSGSPRVRAAGTPAMVVLLVGLGLAQLSLDRDDPEKLAMKRAALWVRGSAPGSCVAAHRRRTAYYANADRFVALRSELPPGALPDLLQAERVHYIVVAADRWGHMGAALADAVDEVHRVEYPGGAALVLRLADRDPPSGRSP